MKKRLIENRKAKLEYITDWQKNLKQANDLAPQVQKMKENTMWELDAFQDIPEEIKDFLTEDIEKHCDDNLNSLKLGLPIMPEYDPQKFSDSDANSTAGTIISYGFVSSFKNHETESVRKYSLEYSESYQQLQLLHNKPSQIINLLERYHFSNTSIRFNQAVTFFNNFKARLTSKSAAAMEIRKFMDGLKGDLLKVAKNHEEENNPSWETIASRLLRNGISNHIYFTFLDQESIRNNLYSQLSAIGKSRESFETLSLEDIWTKLIDHTYILLVSIDPTTIEERQNH